MMSAPPTEDVIPRVAQSLFEALPGLPPERMVDILEFTPSNTRSSFNPDNMEKASVMRSRSHHLLSKGGVA